jgi:hypothetical protein
MKLLRWAPLPLAFALILPAAAQQRTAKEREPLGRLFFTPAQRQDLDRRRQLNIQESLPAAVEARITLNGQVTRSGGRSTTWINGAPEHDTYKASDPSSVAIRTGEESPRVPVRVGQTLDNGRGEVTDGLGAGASK